MLSRTLRFCFTQGHKHLNHAQISAKMNDLRKHVAKATEQLTQLKQQVKEKEKETMLKNNAIHDKRKKLTEDVRKSEAVWDNAKKQSEAHKSTAIEGFAINLINLGDYFNEIKRHESQKHSVDLREGFDNTARLFFNTLEKFKIQKLEVKEGDKVNRANVEVVGEQKGQEGQKGKIVKVVEPGWQVGAKVIRKPKVILFS